MPNLRKLVIVLALVPASYGATALASGSGGDIGYSRVAELMFCDGARSSAETRRSPDGSKTVVAREIASGDSQLAVQVNGVSLRQRPPFWACTELAWSSDSKAFFLTYSTGGLVGHYQVRVYYPTPTAIRVVDPTRAAERDFLAHYPKCFDPERPNLAGIAWLSASTLLVAAQVLPHSNCDSSGTFAAYAVELPSGKVLRKYGQIESKQEFETLLGPELRHANDECVRNPRACWVSALHKTKRLPANKALHPTPAARDHEPVTASR